MGGASAVAARSAAVAVVVSPAGVLVTAVLAPPGIVVTRTGGARRLSADGVARRLGFEGDAPGPRAVVFRAGDDGTRRRCRRRRNPERGGRGRRLLDAGRLDRRGRGRGGARPHR